MPAAPPLHLDLKPSRSLVIALLLVHALALAAAGIGLAGWTLYLAFAAILASLGTSLSRALLRAARQPISLELNEDGRVSWRNRAGIWREGSLGRSHFVSAVFAIVELETPPAGTKSVVLAADSMPPEDFRRLRAWLRWRRSPSAPEPE